MPIRARITAGMMADSTTVRPRPSRIRSGRREPRGRCGTRVPAVHPGRDLNAGCCEAHGRVASLRMRVALVSPYAWSSPGGVNRHVTGLAGELRSRGHEAIVFAPGVMPHDGPDWVVPVRGATVGLAFNGAMSNVTLN